ncbi:MAG TPA: hypothetical protein VL068_08695 [Microthrixaceae bacterium]|nr:hypothetical protein [Microthrixaceae bacterium]
MIDGRVAEELCCDDISTGSPVTSPLHPRLVARIGDGATALAAIRAGALIGSVSHLLCARELSVAVAEAIWLRIALHARSCARKPRLARFIERAAGHTAVLRRAAETLHSAASFCALTPAQAVGELWIHGVPRERLDLFA